MSTAQPSVVYWNTSAIVSALSRDRYLDEASAAARTPGTHLMSSLGWAEVRAVVAHIERERPLTPVLVTAAREAVYLADRKFVAERPDQLWVADITYIPTRTGFIYLAVVLDACSRRVVGWAMAYHLRKELVLDVLDVAIFPRRPTSVVHYSDQEMEYTSIAFGQRCQEVGSSAVDGIGRRLLRQCDMRKLQRYTGMRVTRAQSHQNIT